MPTFEKVLEGGRSWGARRSVLVAELCELREQLAVSELGAQRTSVPTTTLHRSRDVSSSGTSTLSRLEEAEQRAAALSSAVSTEEARIEREAREESQRELIAQLQARVAELETQSSVGESMLRDKLARALQDNAIFEERAVRRAEAAASRAKEFKRLLDTSNANNQLLLAQAIKHHEDRDALSALTSEKLTRQSEKIALLEDELARERKVRREAQQLARRVEARVGTEQDASALRERCMLLIDEADQCDKLKMRSKRLEAEVRRLRLEVQRHRSARRRSENNDSATPHDTSCVPKWRGH